MEIKMIVIEKWSERPIVDALIYINDVFTGKTNESGILTRYADIGMYKICAAKEGWETNCQNFLVTGNVTLNIQLKPIVSIL